MEEDFVGPKRADRYAPAPHPLPGLNRPRVSAPHAGRLFKERLLFVFVLYNRPAINHVHRRRVVPNTIEQAPQFFGLEVIDRHEMPLGPFAGEFHRDLIGRRGQEQVLVISPFDRPDPDVACTDQFEVVDAGNGEYPPVLYRLDDSERRTIR